MPFSLRRAVVKAPAVAAPWRPASDRRCEGRRRTDLDQATSARLVGGIDVKLRNLSSSGVSFESPIGMRVGTRVTLRLRTSTDGTTLPGEVVRCRVTATRHGRLRYETALTLSAAAAEGGGAVDGVDAVSLERSR